jgi:ABC-2 type transport system ATP-binding protein
MRMMVGLISITEGDVVIEGHSITSEFKQAIAKIGGIVENLSFYPFLSGYDNLKYYARMAKGVTAKLMRLFHYLDWRMRFIKNKNIFIGRRQ